MQLLEIHTIPIQYQIHIEPARLEVQDASAQPSIQTHQQSAQLIQHTSNPQLKLDAYPVRKSLGLLNATDFAKTQAEKGEKHVAEVTQDRVKIGKELSHIEKGVTISDIVRQKALQQPSYVTVFLPNGHTQISWKPGSITSRYEAGEAVSNWQLTKPQYSFIPGTFSLKITQWPHVEVKYLGGFNYVPPSADPNYQEKES